MKIFEFQNDLLKTNLQTKFSVKCSASGPKVTTKSMFVINFNFEWITLAVKQISENTKKLIWVIKEQNMQTFILRPIFASICVHKWTSVKHDLFHCLARDRKKKRIVNIFRQKLFGKKSVRQTACPQRYLIGSQ